MRDDQRMVLILTPDTRTVGFQIRSRGPKVDGIKATIREYVRAGR